MSKLIKQMEMDALSGTFKDVRDLIMLSMSGLNATVDNHLRLGLRKIAQLGYFQVGDDPAVKPKGDTDRVDVQVQGTESSRNEIQVGGGVSGLEGGFFQASYATRNFLGRGEIFSTYIQTGARANRYSLNFTEPWFLGRPWTLGFSIFKRQTDYSGLRQIGSGGTVSLGRLLGAADGWKEGLTAEYEREMRPYASANVKMSFERASRLMSITELTKTI